MSPQPVMDREPESSPGSENTITMQPYYLSQALRGKKKSLGDKCPTIYGKKNRYFWKTTEGAPSVPHKHKQTNRRMFVYHPRPWRSLVPSDVSLSPPIAKRRTGTKD